MNNNSKEDATVVAVIVGMLTIVATVIGIASDTFKAFSDYEVSPLNPLNQPKLTWHDVRSNAPKPVDGMYCSRIEVEIRNSSRMKVEHVAVLIKPLTKTPCIMCEGGEDSEAPDNHRLVKIPVLTGHNSVKVVVTEWLPKFPTQVDFFSEGDGEYLFAGDIVKVTYEKGKIERDTQKCKVNFSKLEPIPVLPGVESIPDTRKPKDVPLVAPSVVQKRPSQLTQVLPSKSSCGCGKPNCRCGAKCRCQPVASTLRRARSR